MPPKITKTRVPKARQHGVRRYKHIGPDRRAVYAEVTHRASLDLCKIDTNKLRRLSASKLSAAASRISGTKVLWHRKLRNFVGALYSAKQKISPGYLDYLKRTEGEINPDWEAKARQEDAKTRRWWVQHADRLERDFQELQERAGCKLKPYELVARDAERQGNKRLARVIRRDARRPLRGLRKRR